MSSQIQPFIAKLEHGADLTADDRAFLVNLISRTRQLGPGVDVIGEGDAPSHVHVILDGFACRYLELEDGGRQILALLVPGDFCDMHIAILGQMDHSIGTITACKLAEIPRQVMDTISTERPTVARAFWWASLVDEAILRQWVVGMGRRSSEVQMAHLFCELWWRLRTVGKVERLRYPMPLTQAQLADLLGISAVHINRVLQSLRARNLFTLGQGSVEITDRGKLEEFANFNPLYLHLRRPPDASRSPTA